LESVFKLAPLPRNVEAALRDISHDKEQIRLSALRDLARLAAGPERQQVVNKLVNVLAEDGSPDVRARAAITLADARAHTAGPSLVKALRDPSDYVRQMALLALGEVGTARAEEVAAVRAALDDSSAALRFQALVALHHLSPKDVDAVLEQKLSDEDPEVRFVAIRIAEERLVEAQQACPAWLLDKLSSLLRDDVSYVRLLAAIALHRSGQATDAEVLADAASVRAGVREPEDEQAAIEIAGELRLEQARSGLERRAFGFWGFTRDPFAWQARVALAKMGHPRAVAALLADLKAWTWETRTLAAAAAGAARLLPARARLLAMLGDAESANQDTVRDALRQIDSA
jgi:HEAT repeat protein